VKVLAANRYNVTHSAREPGITRQHVQNLMRKYGIVRREE
jgi:transcriptional regulator with GAF, ATPase, and Fis domain